MSEEALRETAGNKQKAAQALGLSRQGLIKKDEEVETQLVVWSRPRKFCFGRFRRKFRIFSNRGNDMVASQAHKSIP